MASAPLTINLRIRLVAGDGRFAMGPGKARLLDAIQETGSISAAARRLGMSYRKTRVLVNEMNLSFRTQLVEASKGGNLHGGANLTDMGKEVLIQFKAMEALALDAINSRIEAFATLAAPLVPSQRP